MLKNRIYTISFREIKSSFKRFLTIVLMSMLGVGTFVGLSATAPDMINSLDKYYDKQNFYDIKLLSTLGISEKTVNSIKRIEGVEDVYGIYSKDVLATINKDETVIKIISINDNINKIELLSGTLPKKENEIVVESLLLSINNLKIGDEISFSDESFNNKSFKIVGVVKSPLFITTFKALPNRGNTNLGNGKISYYAYVNENSFNLDYYTEMYVTVKDSKNFITNSKKYNDIVSNVYDEINREKNNLEKERYDEIYNQYKSKIDREKLENEKKLNDAKNLLDKSGYELLSGKKKLDKAKQELSKAKLELDSKNVEIDKAKNDLILFNEKLLSGKKELDNGKKLIEDELSKYGLSYNYVLNLINVLSKNNLSKSDIESIIPTKIENYNEIIKAINDAYSFDLENLVKKEDIISIIPEDIEEYDNIVNTINAIYNFDLNNYKESKNDLINVIPKDINNYDEIISTIDYLYDNSLLKIINDSLGNYNRIDNLISEIPKEFILHDDIVSLLQQIKDICKKVLELEDGILKIEKGYNEYYKNKALYENLMKQYSYGVNLYNNYLSQYKDGLKEYNSSYKLYTNGLNLYNSKLKEYYKAKSLFDEKINDAYSKLDEIPESNLYIYNRLDSADYSSYIDDSESVSNLSKLFPTVFFIVSVLISLVSMSRMVEDDRGLIGTLKSLGFSNFDILKKYLIYSLCATVIGGAVGSLLGFYLLSYYIFTMYKLMFSVEKFVIYYDLKYIIIGLLISVICICGTTYITVKKNVKDKPANLLRPKSPPSGKRVLLEKISFIWRRLNFSNKITTRNLLRYKKRGILTIIGIIGCTALLLTGFGLRDSIVNIPSEQYKNVFTFDDMVYLMNDKDIDNIFNTDEIKNYAKVKILTGSHKKNDVNLLAVENTSQLQNVFKLKDVKSNKKINLQDKSVIITDKLAELSNTKIGEYITYTDSSGKSYKFIVSGICKNYVGHYIIMNKKTYENYFGTYSTNVVFYNLNDIKSDDIVSKDILKNKNVMSILSVNSTKRQVDNMLKVLDSIVLILIFLAGGLSIVVLYNLSYINISERRREIATLKVLGFTHREVDNYINKETIILTIIGITMGLIGGIVLADLVISTVEISQVRFIHQIEPLSFILTSLIIIIFTLIINLSAHFSLKNIDMIESLKSVE